VERSIKVSNRVGVRKRFEACFDNRQGGTIVSGHMSAPRSRTEGLQRHTKAPSRTAFQCGGTIHLK
jgi:hypothetical protein